MDTIFALASARGKAGIAVIRISGPSAFDAARALAGDLPKPRVAGLRDLSFDGQFLDSALVLCFADGASFTGEQSVELHLHGAVATVAAVSRVLTGMQGLRHAEPGEFTRRALENGQLDLAQVEGLADLIEAETEAQRVQALRVLSGEIGQKAAAWRKGLIRALALLEATIDFADEDVPVDVAPEVLSLIADVGRDLQAELDGFGVAERIRDGFEVAIVGRPNAGKSTLLNALAGRDAAITSEFAGTTRDVIEVRMDLDGVPVTVLDTAGLRNAEDAVEAIGVQRALDRAAAADLRIILMDDQDLPMIEPQPGDLVVQGKSDVNKMAGLSVSGKTGQGVSALVSAIGAELKERMARAATITRERHRAAIARALGALEAAKDLIASDVGLTELAAEELRGACHALDGLVGLVDVEHLLDEIFSSFCIGK